MAFAVFQVQLDTVPAGGLAHGEAC